MTVEENANEGEVENENRSYDGLVCASEEMHVQKLWKEIMPWKMNALLF